MFKTLLLILLFGYFLVFQGYGTSNSPIGVPTNGNASTKNIKPGEIVTKCSIKGKYLNTCIKSYGVLINSQVPSLDSRNAFSDLNIKSNYIAKEVVETKPPVRSKRKNSTLNSKSKRLRVDSEELIELKLTVVQAQQLMRPSPNDAPTIFYIEGCDFEEYEVPGFNAVSTI